MADQTRKREASGLLGWIELVGNTLPHPFWMLVWITLFIVVFSAVAALIGISAVDPGTGEVVRTHTLASGEGLRRLLEEMVTNFAHLAPFGMVLVMLMGVSVAKLTDPLMFILFTILVPVFNIFIGSGSAKWAIFAPIFIPMLAPLNDSPAFIQLMYRVGDAITKCNSPLDVGFPLLMGRVRRRDRSMGIGTFLSRLIPYALLLFFLWVILVFVWSWFDLPNGVGEGVFLRS